MIKYLKIIKNNFVFLNVVKIKSFFETTKLRRFAFSLPYQYADDSNESIVSPIGGKVLVLNQSYEPLFVCSPKKAMILLFLTKAEMVLPRRNKFIRTISASFPFPSVIRLIQFVRMPYKKIDLSRKNILRRDDNQCQYCGTKKTSMTIDHIIPKSRGGMDTWDNLAAACVKCNNRKGNRTPEEAKMPLLKKPRKPHYIIFLKQYLGRREDEWKQFLFME